MNLHSSVTRLRSGRGFIGVLLSIPNERLLVVLLGCNLMKCENSGSINWLKSLDPNGGGIYNRDGRQWIEPDLYVKTDNLFFPLYYMSYHGVSGVVQLILNKDTDFFDIDRTSASAASNEG